MKYAIVKIGGKQLKITEGETLKIEKQGKLVFDVLVYSDAGDIMIGEPVLSGIKIKASVVGEELGKKVRVGRFKAKSRYTKTKGHRQPLSIIKIEEISKVGERPQKPTETTEKAKTVRKPAVRKTAAKSSR